MITSKDDLNALNGIFLRARLLDTRTLEYYRVSVEAHSVFSTHSFRFSGLEVHSLYVEKLSFSTWLAFFRNDSELSCLCFSQVFFIELVRIMNACSFFFVRRFENYRGDRDTRMEEGCNKRKSSRRSNL